MVTITETHIIKEDYVVLEIRIDSKRNGKEQNILFEAWVMISYDQSESEFVASPTRRFSIEASYARGGKEWGRCQVWTGHKHPSHFDALAKYAIGVIDPIAEDVIDQMNQSDDHPSLSAAERNR